MAFSEPVFLFLFLPSLLLIYPKLPLSVRNAALAAASILFYAWDEPANTVLLLGSIGVNYFIGLGLNPDRSVKRRKFTLALGVTANLFLLGWFKYAGWLLTELNPLLSALRLPSILPPNPELPLGISFFTFQAISYLFDVHRGICPVQRKLTDLALYISLFPQLVAGPIVRYTEMARQLIERRITQRGTAMGIRRFVIGLAKKVIVADTLAIPADAIFSLPTTDLTMPVAWLGATCYAFQIYFDFSGYTDMAIGLGRMLGFKIPENFRYPYLACSVTDFWRRWHLTLSRWFRDYLYIPLGGNRISANRTYLNLAIVFLLCGLWHGASWTFVLWGLYHGSLLVIERMARPFVLPQGVRWLTTAFLLLLGWVLFRSPTVEAAISFTLAMIGTSFGSANYVEMTDFLTTEIALVLFIAASAAAAIQPAIRRGISRRIRSATDRAIRARRLTLWHRITDFSTITLFLLVCIRISANTYVPFLYFRF